MLFNKIKTKINNYLNLSMCISPINIRLAFFWKAQKSMLILRNLTTKKPGKRNEPIAGKGDISLIKQEKVLIYGCYAQAKKRENRMINLLQENIEMESQRINSTFVFLPTHRQTLKNKRAIFCQRFEKKLEFKR